MHRAWVRLERGSQEERMRDEAGPDLKKEKLGVSMD